MTRVLVVEDNTNLAFGLRNNLEIEGYEVTVAADGDDGLSQARAQSPDLVVLDLMLPRLDGFRVLKALREEGFKAPILVLTARGDEADKVRALKLGADDYVTKPFGVLELLARLEALLRRSAGGRDDIRPLTLGAIEILPAEGVVRLGGEPVMLTPKEFDLLMALARRKGFLVSRAELLKEVWGYRAGVTSRTVDTHVASLRRKLERDPSAPQHILTVRTRGYRLQ